MKDIKCEDHGIELRYICTRSEKMDYLSKPFCFMCYDKEKI